MDSLNDNAADNSLPPSSPSLQPQDPPPPPPAAAATAAAAPVAAVPAPAPANPDPQLMNFLESLLGPEIWQRYGQAIDLFVSSRNPTLHTHPPPPPPPPMHSQPSRRPSPLALNIEQMVPSLHPRVIANIVASHQMRAEQRAAQREAAPMGSHKRRHGGRKRWGPPPDPSSGPANKRPRPDGGAGAGGTMA